MSESEPLELSSFHVVVYGSLFAATIGGQFLGMVLDAAVLGRRLVWVPLACSVTLEAIVGARVAMARRGRPLTSAELGRISGNYSAGLAAVTLPMLVWTAASRSLQAPFGGLNPTLAALLGLAILGVLTLVRWGLMVLAGKAGT